MPSTLPAIIDDLARGHSTKRPACHTVTIDSNGAGRFFRIIGKVYVIHHL
jgi:hypothetical protein